jgi:hypothetical protein
MDLSAIIRQRLDQLGHEQKDLAIAAEVTESYISQLLTRKKAPPEPARTDIYGKIEDFLKFRHGEIVKLVQLQRQEVLKRKLVDPPPPLFKEVRELVLRKCKPGKQKQVRMIFERQPLGELEFLVTQKLLDVVKGIAMQELENEDWLRLVGSLNGQSYEETRVTILEFLDIDVLNVSLEHCASFLDPLIESWDIDLANFNLEITLNQRIVPGHIKRFGFVEQPASPGEEDPGLKQFLQDAYFRKGATEEEIEYLRALKLNGRHPTPLFYYRELQNLRDPLHFRDAIERGPCGGETPTLPGNTTRSEPPAVSRGGGFDQASGPSSDES